MQSASANEIEALRLKLTLLVDALTHLQSQLHAASQSAPTPTSSNPGILPWPDLLSRYNLLMSHIVGLGALLSSVGDGREVKRGEEGMDKKRDKWDGSVVVPAVEVEESKEWLVGMLLRTKQTPEVEAHLAKLVASLPVAFSDPATHATALQAHTSLAEAAYKRITDLKEGLDGEEWDWKGRVEVDSDDEEEEDEEEEDAEDTRMEEAGGEVKGKGKEVQIVGRQMSLQEVVAYQRTGKLPP